MATYPKSWPDYAGLRAWRKHPVVKGGYVAIYDARDSGVDATGGRWSTVCEVHGEVIAHETLALAKWHLLDVEEWCEECQALARSRRQKALYECPHAG